MSSLVRIQKGNGSASVFCVLFSGGFKTEFYSFARLAPMVGRDYSFYGVIARGTDGLSRPHQSVEDMAKAYIEEMRSVQPQGPYFLIGECFSAPVAYEIARQLRLDGQIVGLLAVLDGQGNRHWVYRYLGNRLGARVRYVMINIRDTSTVMYLRHGIPFHLGEIRKKGVTPWLLHLLRRRVSARLSPTTQISESRIPVLKPSPALRRAHKAYSLAVRRYERPPYEGKITVIANEEWYRADSTLGWDAVGGVESHAIPGDHNTYLKKHPQMVADLLRAGIEAGKAHSETGERHAAAS
jgi:surfactin synthase thioesterase subunit